jgi:hypothetical protein
MIYRVWITVELETPTPDGETHVDLDLGFASSATFKTEHAAIRFANQLHAIADVLAPLLIKNADKDTD